MRPSTSWIIAYDIADPRRLNRIRHAVSDFAVRIQYSVYWARLNPSDLNAGLRSLAMRMDAKADDVRFYPLPEAVQIHRLGRDVLPQGVRFDAAGFEPFVRERSLPEDRHYPSGQAAVRLRNIDR